MNITRENSIFGRDRRRATRHKVHLPAYASLSGSTQGAALELCEILNINESGMCFQAPGPMKVNRLLPLALDLSQTDTRIHTTGHVVWSGHSGMTGVRFPELPAAVRVQLQQWIAANDAARLARAAETPPHGEAEIDQKAVHARPGSAASYSSLIHEWAEIEKDVGLYGPDLAPALQMIAERALTLTWATGAAIALINKLKPSELICRARAGSDSPEMGARLEAGSGFSGKCVRAATTLICDDTETDPHVDRQSCRALGIRSLMACPVKSLKGEVIGIIEVFSPEPAAFWDNDSLILNRLARITASAVSHAEHSRPGILEVPHSDDAEPDLLSNTIRSFEEQAVSTRGPQYGRKALWFALGLAAIMLAVWLAAPWMADSLARLASRSNAQAAEASPMNDTYFEMSTKDLQQAAIQDGGPAQYALAMRYASGDGVKQNYHEAMTWFLKAADNGEVRAAAKLATCFWAGKGAPQDYSKAYFWGLLAQAAGDETGRVIVINSAPHLSDHQRFAGQRQADNWLRSHHMGSSSTQ